jgi:hypothetical protein
VVLSAINAKQLLVKFTAEVDADTAEDDANYTITDKDGNAVALEAGSEAVLGEDNKSVVLTLDNGITTKTDLVVTVKNVALKSDTTKTVPLFSTTVTVEDTVAPDVASVSSKTNGDVATSLTITYSEPVKAGLIKIDGVNTGVTANSASGLTQTLNNLNLDANTSHKLEIVNLTDEGDNAKPLVSKTFSIEKDVNAPAVSSVTAYGDSKLLVTFSKKMNATTLNDTTISVKDESLADVTVNSVDALPGDTTGTKFLVDLDASTFYTSKTSRTLTVVFAEDAIEDSLGNKLALTTKTVTISKDTVAPKVTGLSYKKNAAGEVATITVTFDEELSDVTDVDENTVTVVDADGVKLTGFFQDGTAVTAGDKEVTFTLATPAKLAGTYTFTIPAGLVTDQATTPNKNAAYTGTINFGEAAPGQWELASVGNNGTNVIEVDFGQAVKGGAVDGSATDPSKYTLNGAALPEGTVITLDSNKQIATITLPPNSIAVSDDAAIFTVAGVKNAAGTLITPYTGTVEVTDNIAPELQSASLFSYDAATDEAVIILTFNENIDALSSADVGTEFAIYNGSTNAVATTGITADSVAGKAKQVKLTVTGVDLNTAKSISIKTLDIDPNLVIDAEGNEMKGDVTVTVAK